GKCPAIERLNIDQLVPKLIPSGVDFPVGQRMKHECVVRVGTMPDANKRLWLLETWSCGRCSQCGLLEMASGSCATQLYLTANIRSSATRANRAVSGST